MCKRSSSHLAASLSSLPLALSLCPTVSSSNSFTLQRISEGRIAKLRRKLCEFLAPLPTNVQCRETLPLSDLRRPPLHNCKIELFSLSQLSPLLSLRSFRCSVQTQVKWQFRAKATDFVSLKSEEGRASLWQVHLKRGGRATLATGPIAFCDTRKIGGKMGYS